MEDALKALMSVESGEKVDLLKKIIGALASSKEGEEEKQYHMFGDVLEGYGDYFIVATSKTNALLYMLKRVLEKIQGDIELGSCTTESQAASLEGGTVWQET